MSAAEVAEGKTPDSEIPGTQRRKHRHDLGHEDHGPVVATGTTRGIQALLGLWIALTMILVVYALVDGSRPKRDMSGMSDRANTVESR
ncbi:MAG: hypothetical protein H0T89_03650 [Deltaproteobacteria bacterium]|nr:hypothetical protein [Deltaproteobacteria bacterium]MDQ3301276.1 hypothetical protein [Myxococcota bacterium]